jgi:hypothetical protein
MIVCLPEGKSFVLVGREVASIDPQRERPLRRFALPWSGDRSLVTFLAPAVGKGRLYVTHRSGDLYAFDTEQLARPPDAPAPAPEGG